MEIGCFARCETFPRGFRFGGRIRFYEELPRYGHCRPLSPASFNFITKFDFVRPSCSYSFYSSSSSSLQILFFALLLPLSQTAKELLWQRNCARQYIYHCSTRMHWFASPVKGDLTLYCFGNSHHVFGLCVLMKHFADLFWSIAPDGTVSHVPCPLRKADGSIAISRLRPYLDPFEHRCLPFLIYNNFPLTFHHNARIEVTNARQNPQRRIWQRPQRWRLALVTGSRCAYKSPRARMLHMRRHWIQLCESDDKVHAVPLLLPP